MILVFNFIVPRLSRKDDKEGQVDSGGESTSLFDVGERQFFQIHKFNLNL